VSNAEIASCQIPSIFQDGFVEGMIVLGTSDERWLKNLYKACRKLVVVDEAPEGLLAVERQLRGGTPSGAISGSAATAPSPSSPAIGQA